MTSISFIEETYIFQKTSKIIEKTADFNGYIT
jgi:hypothetical protein